MNDDKKEYGQFFSTNKELIQPFEHHIKANDILIDPFAGNLDLLKFFKNPKKSYDLFPLQEETIQNDSLLNPPDFHGKFVITNPPYLNINKTKNKEVFKKYDTDDLYKASLKTIIATADKGIIILPSAFWFNERAATIRKDFLEIFEVEKVIIFNKQMFKDTTYTVGSFYFERKNKKSACNIHFIFEGANAGEIVLIYSKENDYSILNDVEKQLLPKPKGIIIGRYTSKEQLPTNIYLHCIDTSDRIRVEIKAPYMGISTDRAFLTFTLKGDILSEKDEILLVKIFNQELEQIRLLYADSFLSNYRNAGRKRISFTFAYKLFAHCLVKIRQKI